MTNHEITGKQMQTTLILFWTGSIVVAGINPLAKQDSWISLLFAGVMALPLLALYSRVANLHPGLNLFEILFKIFGGIFGRILSLVFVLFAIHLGSNVIYTFTEFIKIENMPETPEFFTVVFIILLSMWCVKSGPENIGRVSKFCWPVIFVTSAMTFLVALKDMDINNLKPVMETDFKSLLGGAFSYFILPFGEIVLCLSLFSSINTKVITPKILIKSLVSTILFYIMITLRNVLILGVPSALEFYFPSYQSVGLISIGDFFSRIEILIGLDLMLTGSIKIFVCLYAASLGLAKVCNISDQKTVVAACALLMGTLSGILYKNTLLFVETIKYYQLYAILFELIFPLIMWMGAEIQNKIKASSTALKTDSPN
jgi:spore germination protein KB